MTANGEQESWPTRTEAAKQLGVSTSSVRRLEKTGDLTPHLVDGVHRFDPTDIEAYRAANADIAVDDPQAQVLTAHARHIESLIKLTHAPATRHIELQQQTIEQLQQRVNHLEASHAETVQAYERLLSEKHERDLMAEQVRSDEQRKQEVTQFMMHAADELKGQFLASGQLAKMVQSLTDEQVYVLTNADLLTEEQSAAIKRIRAQRDAPKQREARRTAESQTTEDDENGTATKEPQRGTAHAER